MKVLNIIRKEVVRVDDDEIVELFLKKDESAIIHTAEKYGCRLRSISQRITADVLLLVMMLVRIRQHSC